LSRGVRRASRESKELNNAVNRVTPINVALASRHSRIGVECPLGRVFVDTITLGDIAKVVDVEGRFLRWIAKAANMM
jgi:hypothetical protein